MEVGANERVLYLAEPNKLPLEWQEEHVFYMGQTKSFIAPPVSLGPQLMKTTSLARQQHTHRDRARSSKITNEHNYSMKRESEMIIQM